MKTFSYIIIQSNTICFCFFATFSELKKMLFSVDPLTNYARHIAQGGGVTDHSWEKIAVEITVRWHLKQSFEHTKQTLVCVRPFFPVNDIMCQVC